MALKETLKGKRIAGIDYGRKRTGLAVCDEFHITVSPRRFFLMDSVNFWDELLEALKSERVEAIVVGVPYRLDEIVTDLIKEILDFIKELELKSNITVIPYDESYSSHKSLQTMLEIGVKKKQRAKKGNMDKIAAAVILRDFLQELEG
ncbi:MAG: Holliday junction resolvase RuvX [FCB group bacterium]